MSAGAKLTVTFIRGSRKAELASALSTRCLLSRTALSGSPTIKKVDSVPSPPFVKKAFTSSVTEMAFSPLSAALLILANMRFFLRFQAEKMRGF